MTNLYNNLLFIILFYPITFAQWSNDPSVNTPISTASNDQANPAIISDNNGGAIIVWEDDRDGNNNIFAQRISSAGIVQWTANGIPVCSDPGFQYGPQIISDGSGGAIIVWEDVRNGFPNIDIYAQRVDANGNILWTPNGKIVYDFFNYTTLRDVISDNAGGAIIVWDDFRSAFGTDIYAQRIDANGNLLWDSNGVAISTAINEQSFAQMTSDGNNGAIISFINDVGSSGSPSLTIYAQKVSGGGVAQWVANGVQVCSTGTETIPPPVITYDGNGGAIIAWTDERSGTSTDIYAQRINASGVVQWTANGIPVSNASGISESGVNITSDNANGAVLVWYDERGGSGLHIYAQRINSSGSFLWSSSGMPVFTVNNREISDLQIISDNLNNSLVVWTDFTSMTNWNLFAQKLDTNGVLQWNVSGVAISNAINIQSELAFIADGQGGLIAAWNDWRDINSTGLDIYAQKVFQDGVVPVELLSLRVSHYSSGVKITWITMNEVNNFGFEIERMRESNSSWEKLGFVAGNGNSNSIKIYNYFDEEVSYGRYAYRLKQIDNDGSYEYTNIVEIDLGLPEKHVLIQNYPNPFNPTTKIAFVIPSGARNLVTLKVYDVLGTEVATLVNEYKEAGRYEIEFNAAYLPSGIYFYMLQSGKFSDVKKMELMR